MADLYTQSLLMMGDEEFARVYGASIAINVVVSWPVLKQISTSEQNTPGESPVRRSECASGLLKPVGFDNTAWTQHLIIDS